LTKYGGVVVVKINVSTPSSNSGDNSRAAATAIVNASSSKPAKRRCADWRAFDLRWLRAISSLVNLNHGV